MIIGARSGDREQFEIAAEKTHLYTADVVRERGIAAILGEVGADRGAEGLPSIDADAIDRCLTPGLGTPEPPGMTPLDLRGRPHAWPHAAGFDYGVAPFDAGQTAAAAALLVRQFIARHWTGRC